MPYPTASGVAATGSSRPKMPPVMGTGDPIHDEDNSPLLDEDGGEIEEE